MNDGKYYPSKPSSVRKFPWICIMTTVEESQIAPDAGDISVQIIFFVKYGTIKYSPKNHDHTRQNL